jgi:hypothetical protein
MHGRIDPNPEIRYAVPCCGQPYNECQCRQTKGLGGVVINVFCKTGAGGGVDPTCGGGKGGTGQIAGPLKDGSVSNWEEAISWAHKHPYKVEEGVRGYQGQAAEDLNKSLRKNQEPTGRAKEVHDSLSYLHSKGEFKAEGTVLRGTAHGLGDLKVGDKFTEKGYMSTTTDMSVAVRFAKTGGSGGLVNVTPEVIRIKTKHGLLVGGPEREVILNKGSKFKVAAVSIQEVKKNDWSDDTMKINVVDLEHDD